MTTIRPATPDDVQALAELRWDFRTGPGRAPAVEDRQAFVERCAAWMARELAGDAWRAWAAIAHGRIVGQIWVDLICTCSRRRAAALERYCSKPHSPGRAPTESIAWCCGHRRAASRYIAAISSGATPTSWN